MRFSPLLYSHTTIHAGQDKAFTMPANLPSVFFWQTHPSSHGNFPGYIYVALSQSRVFVEGFICQTEKCLNTLHCDAPSFRIHLLTRYSISKLLALNRLAFPQHKTQDLVLLGGFLSQYQKRDAPFSGEPQFFVHVDCRRIIDPNEQAYNSPSRSQGCC